MASPFIHSQLHPPLPLPFPAGFTVACHLISDVPRPRAHVLERGRAIAVITHASHRVRLGSGITSLLVVPRPGEGISRDYLIVLSPLVLGLCLSILDAPRRS